MLKTVANATTELENKIIEYLGKDVCVDIINVDYESFTLVISHPELHHSISFDYHVLMNSLTIKYYEFYGLHDPTYRTFKTASDALKYIKSFLNLVLIYQ